MNKVVNTGNEVELYFYTHNLTDPSDSNKRQVLLNKHNTPVRITYAGIYDPEQTCLRVGKVSLFHKDKFSKKLGRLKAYSRAKSESNHPYSVIPIEKEQDYIKTFVNFCKNDMSQHVASVTSEPIVRTQQNTKATV